MKDRFFKMLNLGIKQFNDLLSGICRTDSFLFHAFHSSCGAFNIPMLKTFFCKTFGRSVSLPLSLQCKQREEDGAESISRLLLLN